jgi:hypothetical protein
MLEVRCTDGSVLRLTLQDQKLELDTPYGKLVIPAAEIHRIEFANPRLSAEQVQRIETALASLGSPQFQLREEATTELFALREKAYPALLRATRNADPEIARRADELVHKIKSTVPAERLEVREFDVVHTPHSRLAGRLVAPTLKVQTAPFGEQQLKLTDLLSLRSLAVTSDPVVTNVLPDPGSLSNLQNQVGQSFHFKVTGAAGGSLWGTDVYTTDSTLATVAVHAGVLQVGQTGIVQVTILAPPPNFQGSNRNGVASGDWGAYPGAYKVSAVR